MQNLRVTTVQSTLFWENIDANLLMFSDKIKDLKGKTDLVILPEMFTTGFSMNPKKTAEKMTGQTMDWFAEKAAELNAVITGSFAVEENGQYFNRLIWMRPNGSFSKYDKRHLFTLAKEDKYYIQGKDRLIVELKGWKICPLICYDLRFPVWSRNTLNYDLLLYVANWPNTRAHHWKSLLLARAIENQSYTIGVNRVGEDASKLRYSGETSIFDFAGNLLHQVSNEENIFTTSLSWNEQKEFRAKLNFLPDRDLFFYR